MNHRWERLEVNVTGQKIQKCIKCSIEKSWLYGDMQCWEYFDPQTFLGTKRTTLLRPDCNLNRGNTMGFHQDGTYVTD